MRYRISDKSYSHDHMKDCCTVYVPLEDICNIGTIVDTLNNDILTTSPSLMSSILEPVILEEMEINSKIINYTLLEISFVKSKSSTSEPLNEISFVIAYTSTKQKNKS